MADRTSAEIFGEVFTYLASQPKTPERDSFAARLWELSGNYDFAPRQMYADKELIDLGLAKRDRRRGVTYLEQRAEVLAEE